LDEYISSHGGLTLPSAEAIAAHGESEWPDIYLIIPHDIPENELPPVPALIERATRVTEHWVEASLFRNKRLDPAQHPLCRPFYSHVIVGFERHIIASTAFTDEEPALLKDVVRLLGATYSEYLKPNCTLLVSRELDVEGSSKVEFAKEYLIPVVHAEWLWSCIREQTLLPFDAYLIGKPTPDTLSVNTEPMTLPTHIFAGQASNERFVISP
jgi:DNA replication regulator DPB11